MTDEVMMLFSQITSVRFFSHRETDAIMMKTENQGILAKDLNASNDHDNIFSSIAAKFLPTWINSVAKRINLISKYWKNEKDTHELQIEHSLGNIISNVVLDKTENKDDLVAPRVEGQQIHLINTVFPKTSIVHIYGKWHSRFSSFWKNLKWLPSNVGYLWVRNYYFVPFAFFMAITKCMIDNILSKD